MTYRFGASVAAVAIAAAATAAIIHGASKNFAPDAVFTGSSLAGWQPIGQSTWRAENGEIIGTPTAAGGGWLLANKPYQDVAVFASFRCAAGCQTGVLLRAERTADGGIKGVFVSLNEGDLFAYRVTLDRQGNQTSRERLRGPGGGQLRVALPPPNPAPATAAAPRAGGPPAIPPFPGGIASPIPRPNTGLRSGDWNTIELVLDANILRAFLNDLGGIGDSVAESEYGAYGPFALYVGGTGEVRFKDVSHKDLQPRVAQPEQVSSKFRMQTLNEFYYSWGPAVADFNRDGTPDIVAGPVLLPRPRLHDGSRDLHRRNHRSGNAIFQRPAVRLRLHGRWVARCAEFGLSARSHSLCESQGRVAPLGRRTRLPTACRASSCC